MNDALLKEAIMRVLPAAPEIPLADYPAEAFPADMSLMCPACGGSDATVQPVEDVEIAKCPCGCEFSARLESVTRKVIRGISERRERRFRRFVERLPLRPPSDIDPADYELFRKIVDEEPELTFKPKSSVPPAWPYWHESVK